MLLRWNPDAMKVAKICQWPNMVLIKVYSSASENSSCSLAGQCWSSLLQCAAWAHHHLCSPSGCYLPLLHVPLSLSSCITHSTSNNTADLFPRIVYLKEYFINANSKRSINKKKTTNSTEFNSFLFTEIKKNLVENWTMSMLFSRQYIATSFNKTKAKTFLIMSLVIFSNQSDL